MAMRKPRLSDNEVFIPAGKGRGRIIHLHELQKDGRTLVNISQYQAVREAQRQKGNVLTLAQDWEAVFYARDHQEDLQLKRFYDSVTSGIQYARWTRTQVHNLRSNCPLVVNIAEIHPKHNIVLRYEEEVIEAPWLPKEQGYIQELDQQTGLPKKLGDKPNPKFNGAYFFINPDLDVAAAIRSGNSGLSLSLSRGPSIVGGWLGVRLAKNFPLESRVR